MRARRSSRSGPKISWRRLLVGAVTAAVVLMFVIAFTQYTPVESRQGLRRAEFGWPFSWLKQDLESLDPRSFPTRIVAKSPQEGDMTMFNLAAFGASVLIVSVFELLVLTLILRLGRARR